MYNVLNATDALKFELVLKFTLHNGSDGNLKVFVNSIVALPRIRYYVCHNVNKDCLKKVTRKHFKPKESIQPWISAVTNHFKNYVDSESEEKKIFHSFILELAQHYVHCKKVKT